jgi:hypothetical protein
MTDRFADEVCVPDVVGLPFHIGRDIANKAGVALANLDPDGPPIGSLAWPGLFYITSQRPSPGSTVYRWDSVAVEISAHGDAERGAARVNGPQPSADTAHAEPESEQFLDLSPFDDRGDW